MKTPVFGEKLQSWYASLSLPHEPTEGIETLNPYTSSTVMTCIHQFCERYYNDSHARVGVFGINPGRFGAGLTGLSFTDPVALRDECGIDNDLGFRKELSSDFVFRAIQAFGGVESFFQSFFLSAVCPLGFVRADVNINFYDTPSLRKAVHDFIIRTMKQQCEFPLRRDYAICLGRGSLAKYFIAINSEHNFFERIVVLDHPRFIMQYRRSRLEEYLQQYVDAFHQCLNKS